MQFFRIFIILAAFSIAAGDASAAGDLKYRIRKRLCQLNDTCDEGGTSSSSGGSSSGGSTADNSPPVIGESVPAQGAVISTVYGYSIPAAAFSDSGDTLTWTLTKADGSALPAWLSFNPATRALSGTPAAGDIGMIALKVTVMDSAAQTASQTFGLTVSATGTSPVATYFLPLQGDKGVSANANLYVFFDRVVKKGSSGNIVIHKASDDSAVMTIPVTSGATTADTGEWGGIAGFLAVNPTAGLAADTAYYVTMDAGVVLSVADDTPFAGISDKTGWMFTTQAVTPSGAVLGYTGANQTYTVPANVSSLRVKMWGAGGGGNYYLNNWYSVMTFISDHGGGGGYSEGTIAVTPGENLTIVVGGGGLYGQNGNPANCAGGWPDGGDGSCPSYSRPWAAGSGGGGRTAIMRGTTDLLTAGGGGGGGSGGGNGAAGGGTAGRNGPACCGGFGGSQTAAGVSGTCGGSAGSGHNGGAADWMGGGGGGGWFGGGGSRDVGNCEKGGGGGSGYIGGAGVTNARTLAGGVDPGEYTYYGDGIFHRMPGNPVDAERNFAVGMGGDGSAAETTKGGDGLVIITPVIASDTVAPTVSTLSPADGAANVAVDVNLVITFSENVQVGIGDIEIRRLSDSQLLETINVADAGKVGIAGAVAAINPATGLANGTDYYVTVAPGAFTDMSDNPFAGISGSAAWNFRTVAAVDPCASNPVAGDVCADGTVYVGLSPDGNVPMYVTRCDAGMSWNGSACAGTRSGIPWNNETSAWTTTGATSTTTGEANTVLLAGLMDAGSPHYAAKYCQDMVGVHGHSDWYLPAKVELNVIYQASVSAGGTFRSSFDLGGLYPSGYYWSSSDDPIYYAWFQSLSDGYQDRNMKNNRHSVRCVRKGNAELGMTVQQGDPAAMDITGGSSPGSNVVFTITNAGELASGTMTVSLTGDTANFSKTADTCNGQVLAASASCSITVQPIATDNGSYTGVLQVVASPGGTVSRSLSGTASGFGPPPVGTVMPDGTVYAGLSPDGNVPMYATRCDAGMSWGGAACTGTRALRAWNKETFNWTSTGVTDWDAGEANTTTLAGLLDAGAPYLAANYCHDLVLHGQDDWYLPARNELNVLKVNASAIGGFDLTGGWPGGYYWSSSEYDASRAYGDYFFGSSSNSSKDNRVSLRCVRR